MSEDPTPPPEGRPTASDEEPAMSTLDGAPEDLEDDENEFWMTYGGRRRSDDEDDEDEFGIAYGGRRRSDREAEELLRQGGVAPTLQDIDRADLREHYGPLRTLFKQRESSYSSFQRQLMQARVSRTYDQYLATVVGRMLALLAGGLLVGLLAAGGLLAAEASGRLPAVIAGLGVPVTTLAGTVLAGSTLLGAIAAGVFWLWRRVLRIRSIIARRRRDINYNLPYAVTFMYALSQAGVNFDRIVDRLAASTETYGAVAEEFDRVAREQDVFGNNLRTGLENLRAVTPSDELRRLIDDIMTVLETGGDMPAFLRDEVDTQLETATDEQEAFMDQLELLSEVFVVGFVAAPLFVLVVLMVISFLGANTISVMAALVYAIVPLGLVAFVVLIDVVSEPFKTRVVSFGRDEGAGERSADGSPEWWRAYQRGRRRSGLRSRAEESIVRIRDDPWRALFFSLPIGVSLPIIGVLTGFTPFGLAALLEQPVQVTTELVVAPLVVATLPVAAVYEYRERQETAFRERFPELLQLLATSNRRGLSLTRGLDIVTDAASGRLADELQRLRNDIAWNADLPGAFESFGDRLLSPSLTRTVNLVAEGARSTSDLHVVLAVAATDTAERARLQRERRQTLQTYLVIVVIGFLVYLLVVLLLAANFLDPIEALGGGSGGGEAGPISLGAVPVDQLRMLLFHSALIQGFGSGMLAGKLAENSLYAGLKYGLGLSVLTVLVFVLA